MTTEQILLQWNRIFQAYKNKKPILSGCKKCCNGFIKIPKTAPDIGWSSKACECKIEAESLRMCLYLLTKSNIPQGYLQFNPLKMLAGNSLLLESNDLLTVNLLLSYIKIDTYKNWAYISGEVGVGKTHIAVALAQLFLLKKQAVYFTNVAKLLDDLRPDSENKAKIMQKVLTSKILILDDIGKEKLSEWVAEKLFIIINERYAWDRKTILTSNVSIEELFKNSNYPVYSRIVGKSILFFIKGKDKRL